MIDQDDLVLAAAGLGDVGAGEGLREDAAGAEGLELEGATMRSAAGDQEDEEQKGESEI
jgi:hypothetical protein